MFALVRTAAEGPGYRHQEIDAPEIAPPERSEPVERRAKDGTQLYAFWNNVNCRRPQVESTDGAERRPGSASGSASSRRRASRTHSSMPPGR